MEIKSSKSRFKGAALVEMAIVLLLLMYLTLGVIQYSWLFLEAQQITNAARSGARVAIRGGATPTEVQAAVTNALATTGMTVGSAVITPSIDPGTGNEVTVKLRTTSNVSLLGNVSFLPTPATLSASVTMAKEGPGP